MNTNTSSKKRKRETQQLHGFNNEVRKKQKMDYQTIMSVLQLVSDHTSSSAAAAYHADNRDDTTRRNVAPDKVLEHIKNKLNEYETIKGLIRMKELKGWSSPPYQQLMNQVLKISQHYPKSMGRFAFDTYLTSNAQLLIDQNTELYVSTLKRISDVEPHAHKIWHWDKELDYAWYIAMIIIKAAYASKGSRDDIWTPSASNRPDSIFTLSSILGNVPAGLIGHLFWLWYVHEDYFSQEVFRVYKHIQLKIAQSKRFRHVMKEYIRAGGYPWADNDSVIQPTIAISLPEWVQNTHTRMPHDTSRFIVLAMFTHAETLCHRIVALHHDPAIAGIWKELLSKRGKLLKKHGISPSDHHVLETRLLTTLMIDYTHGADAPIPSNMEQARSFIRNYMDDKIAGLAQSADDDEDDQAGFADVKNALVDRYTNTIFWSLKEGTSNNNSNNKSFNNSLQFDKIKLKDVSPYSRRFNSMVCGLLLLAYTLIIGDDNLLNSYVDTFHKLVNSLASTEERLFLQTLHAVQNIHLQYCIDSTKL